ncbi:hypothetical protein PFDSM3638_04750 [Pyrococcus furiosus DSM 3638]|nr:MULTISPECIES: hypothetical protein [Pyrococcus]AFN03741.1 hypothetical protein PFC_03960 [Pyrococcus furiosus COM1]MDK2870629.1 hypothetical protein [Pyrococcus sp.]QEK78614.1 hypothetical protein PFDSM3638_04750 [Pyrococcus furiosus DSM 3638]
MQRRTLLATGIVFLLVGTYGLYAVGYPQYPEVKDCVNPFEVVKHLNSVQENWSRVHIFFKLVTSRDFWKLAKPWNVDYSNVKVVKHVLEYNGENITMIAIGIPLKDKKHVVALYEFSKPVQGVKVRGYLIELSQGKLVPRLISVNGGKLTALSNCRHECKSNSDCSYPREFCTKYCCSYDRDYAIDCCLAAGRCGAVCGVGATVCLVNPIGCIACTVCVIANCYDCIEKSCLEWGSGCEYHGA